MKFNLLKTGYVTTSGTVSFDVESIEKILAVIGTVTISGSSNDNIYIDGDLVDRVGVYQIRYYFDSVTNSGTVASGIHFYYKNDEPVPPSGVAPEPYLSLITNIGAGYYYTTVPDLSAPRYIKLNHTVSGTAINGTIVGLEVLNDDSVVDFGSDGNLTSSTTLTSLSYLNYNDYIKEIEVYNSGSSVATAHVFIDPQYNDTDELLSISASESGPWVFARNVDYIISNGDNWTAGQYNHTNTSVIADGKLRLDSGYTVGTYTTPILQNQSVRFAYIDMLSTSVSGAIIAVDNEDYTSTIQIRSSHTKPIDYDVYRVLKGYRPSPGYVYYYYVDYLLKTDAVVFNSYIENGDYFAHSCVGVYSYSPVTTACCINTNGKCFFINIWYGAGGGGIELFLLFNDGNLLSRVDLSCGSVSSSSVIYFIEMCQDDSTWIYLYLDQSSSLGSSGYYLLHFNSTMTLLYKEHSDSDFIIGCDIVKDNSGAMWYSRATGTQAIVKISSTGTVLLTYDSITDPGRLCSTHDGGCWFINNNVLYKLNSKGLLENSILNLEINYELTWVMRDESDYNFLWIVDGVYIRLISLDGRVYKSIYLENFVIIRLYSTKEYLVVYCVESSTMDHYIKFVGKSSGGIDKTISITNCDEYGVKSISYDNPILGDVIPLSDDPVWNSSLEWNKAVTDNAILPREKYNQLKLTLRRPSTDIDSPTVENIYYQDNVEIADIYPGQSKTLYLKISLPDGVTIGGDYSSMLRVWWELPVV